MAIQSRLIDSCSSHVWFVCHNFSGWFWTVKGLLVQEMIPKMIQAGTDIFRLNCSHRRGGDFERVYPLIRKAAQELGRKAGKGGMGRWMAMRYANSWVKRKCWAFAAASAFAGFWRGLAYCGFKENHQNDQKSNGQSSLLGSLVGPAWGAVGWVGGVWQVECLGDLQGPKFRVGELAGDPIELVNGEILEFGISKDGAFVLFFDFKKSNIVISYSRAIVLVSMKH